MKQPKEIFVTFENRKQATYTTAILDILKTDPEVYEITDRETGDLIYIKPRKLKEDYSVIKAELLTRRENVKHFSRDFLRDYIAAVRSTEKPGYNREKDRYTSGNVFMFHAFDNVYSSKFYKENSGAYCEFLSVISA